MKRKLSPWCKEVKKTLIDRDMSVAELCGEVGMCRNYVTTTINGRTYAPALAEKIKELGTDAYYFPSFEEIENFVSEKCIHGDLLITMGAGDVVNIGEALLK